MAHARAGGTFGAAVGWLSPSLLRTTTPALVGFRSPADMWALDASGIALPDDASRWEHGSMHFGAALGLAASVDELNEWPGGAAGVWAHSQELAQMVVDSAPALGLRVISPRQEAEHSAIVALRVPDGVCAPTTAKRLLTEHQLLISSRAGMLRISPHIANSADDVERLLGALRQMLVP
jgi:selenocysteine lyase/cysteine desulfurase